MLSALDEQLLRLASQHKSPREIGKALNISPKDALNRINEILDSRDVYDARQMFLMYLDDLYELKTILQKEVKSSMDQRAVSNLVRVLDQLGSALDKASQANADIGEAISAEQSAFMVRMIVQAFEYAREQFADESVPWDRLDTVFREGLMISD